MMGPEMLIAIVSGFITLTASFLIAMYQTRVELRKFARQLEEKYTTSLFNKRLEVYPLLFKALIDLNNTIEYNNHNKQLLVDFQVKYDSWLAANGVFLTPATAHIIWGYHNFLVDLLGQQYDEVIPEEKWIEIRNVQITIGKCLRAELGVYETKAAGRARLQTPSARNIIDTLDQSSKKIYNKFTH
jgi:hypothetical protein